MNILILGGTGYLGKKMISFLCKKQHIIYATYHTKKENEINSMSKVTWVSSSIYEINKILETRHIDCIINCVCYYGADKDNAFNSNYQFPANILKLSIKNNVKKFITMDSALPDNFNNYTKSKEMFRELGKSLCENNFCFINLRLQMFYGYDEPESRFIPSIVRKMIAGQTVNTTIGTQKRDIISIDDVIFAINSTIISELNGFNDIQVGTDFSPSISEIIDYIWQNTGMKSQINKGSIPLRDNEPDCITDTNNIKKICEWNPAFWQDGLKLMIEKIINTI